MSAHDASREPGLDTMPEEQELNAVTLPVTATPSAAEYPKMTSTGKTKSGIVGPWQLWSAKHPHNFTDKIWSGENAANFASGYLFPSWLKEKEAVSAIEALLQGNTVVTEGVSQFQDWLKISTAEQFELDDRYESRKWLAQICNFWKFIPENSMSMFNEAIHRMAIDNLIVHAFQSRRNNGYLYSQNVPLFIPPDRIAADAALVVPVPTFWERLISQYTNDHCFSWSWRRFATDNVAHSVIAFVFEAKVDDIKVVQRQLIMDFHSAQLHRRALGMKDGPVFGAFLNNGSVLFFVSYWKGNELVVDRLFSRFCVQNFAHFVKCYFAFCTIAEYQIRWLQEEFRRWDENITEQKRKLDESSQNPWRDQFDDEPYGGSRRGYRFGTPGITSCRPPGWRPVFGENDEWPLRDPWWRWDDAQEYDRESEDSDLDNLVVEHLESCSSSEASE